MSEYKMTLRRVMKFSLVAGLALLNTRGSRLSPGSGPEHVDRLASMAMDEERARIEREFTIIN